MTSKSKQQAAYIKKAATLLVERTESPIDFLDSLMDLNRMAYNWQVETGKKGSDPHFITIMLVQELAMPWLKNTAKPIAALEKGIDYIRTFFGANSTHQIAVDLLRSYVNDLKDVCSTEQYHNKYMCVIEWLFDMSELLKKYEEEKLPS